MGHHEHYSHQGCGNKQCQCCQGSDDSRYADKKPQSECDMSNKLLRLADEAWEKVMIKILEAEVEQLCGENMKAMAKVVAKANNQKWEHKVAEKASSHQYEEQLHNLMLGKHQQ